MHISASVSYTQLDVYKRQGQFGGKGLFHIEVVVYELNHHQTVSLMHGQLSRLGNSAFLPRLDDDAVDNDFYRMLELLIQLYLCLLYTSTSIISLIHFTSRKNITATSQTVR